MPESELDELLRRGPYFSCVRCGLGLSPSHPERASSGGWRWLSSSPAGAATIPFDEPLNAALASLGLEIRGGWNGALHWLEGATDGDELLASTGGRENE